LEGVGRKVYVIINYQGIVARERGWRVRLLCPAAPLGPCWGVWGCRRGSEGQGQVGPRVTWYRLESILVTPLQVGAN